MFTRKWRLIALASLVAGSAVATLSCCTVRCCDEKPRNQLVVVTTAPPSDDRVSKEEVAISKGQNDQIVWLLPSGSTIRHVRIALRPGQSVPGVTWPPFVKCGESSTVCMIACEGSTCASGPINPSLQPPKKGIYYDYMFQRSEGQASLDPGIRIDP